MSKAVANVNPSYDTFSVLYDRLNLTLDALSTIVVTTFANSAGGTTSGNGYVEGIFGSNTLFATAGLRGGGVTASANLTISSNTIQGGTVAQFNSNVNVLGVNTTLSSNVTNVVGNNFLVSSNTTFSNTTFFTSPATFNSNVAVNGTAFAITSNVNATGANVFFNSAKVSVQGTSGVFEVTSNTNLNAANVTIQGGTLDLVSTLTKAIPSANANQLGNTVARWALVATTGNFNSTLTASGVINASANVSLTGGQLTVSSNVSLTGGNTSITSTNTTIGSTNLSITANTTHTSNSYTVNSNNVVFGGVAITINANTTIGGTFLNLNTTGITFGGTTVTNNANNVLAGANNTVTGKFTVTGLTVLNGNTTINAVATFGANTVPSSNGISLGTTSQRWNVFANSITTTSVSANTITTANVAANSVLIGGIAEQLTFYVSDLGSNTTSAQTVAQIPRSVYRSGHINIQLKNANNTSYQYSETIYVHDDNDTYVTTYGVVYSNTQIGTVGAYINGANVDIRVLQTVGNLEARVVGHLIK